MIYSQNENKISSPMAESDTSSAEPVEPLDDALAALVPRYLQARCADVRRLAELLSDLDFTAIRTIAHNLKGTGTSYGFPDLTTLGAAMQKSAESLDVDALGHQIRKLGEMVSK
jgi:HPt (histidine-containing phosphotransfer) domain-containing protein